MTKSERSQGRLKGWVLGECNGLCKGDWGRQQLRGQEERGKRALPLRPKLLQRRQTTHHLKQGLVGAGRCEGSPQRGASGIVEVEIFY